MPETSQPALFDQLAYARPFIEGALRRGTGTHTFDDIALGVLAGRYQLFTRPGAAAVTEVIEYPRRRELNMFLVGGDLRVILDAEPDFVRHAREIGADAITLTGRRGWARVLDWPESQLVMRKEVT